MLAILTFALVQAQPLAPDSGETHLRNLQQLTFGGQNAEAYFSRSGRQLIFQRQAADTGCDQMFVMNVDGTGLHRVSDGKGRTTCGYFFAADTRIFYASTEHAAPTCPPRPDYSRGYVWALFDYDIYAADSSGGNAKRLTDNPRYDAEGTLSPDGQTIVFTSLRDGDLDIYTMRVDGSHLTRLTHTLGYDGGPFFSPDGKRIIFASNYKNPHSRNFDLYLVNLDGSGLEQVTTSPEFDAFPMFAPDGKRLVWASNRHGKVPGETNIFIADWVERP